MSCEQAHLVSAYYDGELPAGRRADVEAHLAGCGECRALLAEWQGISARVAAAPQRAMPAGLIEQLEEHFDAAERDRGVLRIAGWLTSAAAAALVASLMLFPTAGSGSRGSGNFGGGNFGGMIESPGRTTVAWQTAAVMPPIEKRDDAVPETVQLAQWMASDLAVSEQR